MKRPEGHLTTVLGFVVLLALGPTALRAQQSVEAPAEVEALQSQIQELAAKVEQLSRQIERLLEAQAAPLDPTSSESPSPGEAEKVAMSAEDLEYERQRLAKQLRRLIEVLERHLQKIGPDGNDKLTVLERRDQVSEWIGEHLSFDIKDGMFRFNVGLRAQLDATVPLSENSILEDEFGSFANSFDVRRFRLFAEGRLLRRWDFKLQLDLGSEDGLMETFVDGFLASKLKVAAFKVGRFTEPYSLEQLTSSNQLGFVERSLPIVAFAPGRNLGVMLHNYGKERRYSWQAAASMPSPEHRRQEGPTLPAARAGPRRFVQVEFQVTHVGEGVMVIGRDLVEAEVGVERPRRVHEAERVEANGAIAGRARGLDAGRRQTPAQSQIPVRRAQPQPLHLAGARPLVGPEADATGQRAIHVGEPDRALGWRVMARQGGQLGLEILEAEIDPEPGLVLEEQRAQGRHVLGAGGGANLDRALRHGCGPPCRARPGPRSAPVRR